MKPILRYQSQLLFRRSYKPQRTIRVRPFKETSLVFRPLNRFVYPAQTRLKRMTGKINSYQSV